MSTYQQKHPHAITHHTKIDADTKKGNKQHYQQFLQENDLTFKCF
jgi:hypothetical protein